MPEVFYPAVIAGLVALAVSGISNSLAVYFNRRTTLEARTRPFREKQFDLSMEAIRCAAALALTRDMPTFAEARLRFLELFFGELVVVEDQDFADAMQTFFDELELVPDDAPLPLADATNWSFANNVLQLASAVRAQSSSAWNLDLPSIDRKSPTAVATGSR